MKKRVTVKKSYRVTLKQIREGLKASQGSAAWKTAVESGMNVLQNGLGCNENFSLMVTQQRIEILT